MKDEKEYRKRLYELRLQEAYYVAEHKEASDSIQQEIYELKKEYCKEKILKRREEIRNGQYKRK